MIDLYLHWFPTRRGLFLGFPKSKHQRRPVVVCMCDLMMSVVTRVGLCHEFMICNINFFCVTSIFHTVIRSCLLYLRCDFRRCSSFLLFLLLFLFANESPSFDFSSSTSLFLPFGSAPPSPSSDSSSSSFSFLIMFTLSSSTSASPSPFHSSSIYSWFARMSSWLEIYVVVF